MDHDDRSCNDDNAHAREGLAVHPHHRRRQRTIVAATTTTLPLHFQMRCCYG
jgi:hypothetical protein